MSLITTCPECGYKLGRSETGTKTETKCPKCKAGLRYEVTEDGVTIRILHLPVYAGL